MRLLAAFLAFANVPLALASGEPQQSLLYQNFVRASEVLDRAVAAHGGDGLLDRTLDIRISFKGTLVNEGHFARPWAQLSYPLDGSLIYSAELRASKSEVTQQESDQRFPSFTIVGPANGLALRTGRSRPDSIPERDLEGRLREELEILPQEYLRQARAGAAGLRALSGTGAYDVLAYTLDTGESRALFLDATTHLLTRVERIDHWTHKGDRLEWRTFADYVERNGMEVPLRSEVHAEGDSYQFNVRTEITKAEFGSLIAGADEFSIPAAFRAGFEGWALQKPRQEGSDGLLPVHDLGNGAYVVDLPESDSRSLLVAFTDFAVVVEAGDRSGLSARLLSTAEHLLPNQPVRYVAMTHHHPLYANGIRPYVQRGITVLTTKGNVAYLRDLATRPYRIHPDEQERRPGKPKIEVVDGTRVIADGKQRLELHEFDYSTHTDEYVLPYLPSHKLIVTGDMVYVLRDEKLRPASPRARAIHRVVQERRLDVRNIMQTWFLSRADSLVPYSALEEQIRLADAKGPGK